LDLRAENQYVEQMDITFSGKPSLSVPTSSSGRRESNPPLKLGKLPFYR
jgi:hypothetical protein